MNTEVGVKGAVAGPSLGSALRRVGRISLWALICLLLVRGASATVAGRGPEAKAPARVSRAGQAEESFAVRFARAYLADPSTPALVDFLAEGAALGAGRPPRVGAGVAQAEVSATEELGEGRSILTVACELRDSRTLYLAVPIVRAGAGGVAARGAPSLVAAPGPAGADGDRPRPLLGSEAGAIAALVGRFTRGYLEAAAPQDLAYFLAPGTAIEPLGGTVRFVSLSGVEQLGAGEGSSRSVIARVRVEDRLSGAFYPLAYRLELIRGARWYVARVEGALS